MTKKEKQNKKRRKTLIAFLFMLFTGIVLATGTYAWFSANRTVKVDDITVQVAASNGLQISANAIDFKTIVNNSDIIKAHEKYPTAKNQLPSDSSFMVPVSTTGVVGAGGTLNMFKGAVVADEDTGDWILETSAAATPATNTTDESVKTGDYVVFDLFMQVSSDSPVYLTEASGITVPESVTSKGLEFAGRVAFVYEGYGVLGDGSAGTSTVETIQGLSTTDTTYSYNVTNAAGSTVTETSPTVTIWEPNMNLHTANGLANAENNYGRDYLGLASTHTFSTNEDVAYKYYGVKGVIAKSDSVAVNATDATNFTEVTPRYSTKSIVAGSRPEVLYLRAGINKVKVYMWVEGQDVDCENSASGTSVLYTLGFSLDK